MLGSIVLCAAVLLGSAQTARPAPDSSVLLKKIVVASAVGAAAAAAGGAVVMVGALALISVVAVPTGVAWASGRQGQFHPVMFAQFTSAALGILVVPFIPLALLVAVFADAAGFAVGMELMGGHGLATLVASLTALAPAAALFTLSLGAQLVLLGLLATIGASSIGGRLPGDAGGRFYLGLVLTAAAAGLLGLVAHAGMVIAARPAIYKALEQRTNNDVTVAR